MTQYINNVCSSLHQGYIGIQNQENTNTRIGQVCKIGAVAFTALSAMTYYTNGPSMYFIASAINFALVRLAAGNNPVINQLCNVGMLASLTLMPLSLFFNPMGIYFIGMTAIYLGGAILLNIQNS